MNSNNPGQPPKENPHPPKTHPPTGPVMGRIKSSPVPKKSGGVTLYIVAVAVSVLLGGAVAVYTSDASKNPLPPPRVDEEVFRAMLPPPDEPVAPVAVAKSRKEVAPTFSPNGEIDVPSVGLRTSPDIDATSLSGSLKKGEEVLILDRRSDAGPAWLKVKTKSGKTGWVFASVVKERKKK